MTSAHKPPASDVFSMNAAPLVLTDTHKKEVTRRVIDSVIDATLKHHQETVRSAAELRTASLVSEIHELYSSIIPSLGDQLPEINYLLVQIRDSLKEILESGHLHLVQNGVPVRGSGG